MDGNNTKKIVEKIERGRKIRSKREQLLKKDKVPEKNLPSTYRGLGHNSRSIALCYFALQECDEGIAEFRTAADHYLSSIRSNYEDKDSIDRVEPVRLRYLLHVALLSGDDSRLRDATDSTSKLAKEYVAEHPDALHHYYYVVALAAEIQDTGDQKTYLDKLDEAIESINPDYVEKKLHVLYRAWWRILSGIVSRDEQVFDQGMTELLDYHAEFASSDSTSPKELVCLSGTALVVLARRKGLDVRVDSEYIPACVDELA